MYEKRPLTKTLNNYIDEKKKSYSEDSKGVVMKKGLSVNQRHFLEVTSKVAYKKFISSDINKDELKNVEVIFKKRSMQSFKTITSNDLQNNTESEQVETDPKEVDSISVSLWDIASLSYAVCISSPRKEVQNSELDYDIYMSLAYSLYKEVYNR